MNNVKFKKFKSSSNLLLQIKHDFHMGTIEGWKRYIIALFIFIFLCFIFQMKFITMTKYEGFRESPNTSDYIIHIFRGMGIFKGNGVELQDKLPQWFLINMFLSFVIGYYPLKDLKEFGPQMLVRSKKRWQWWLSKCIWVIFNVIFYYLIGYGVIIVFSIFNGGISLIPTIEINMIISDVDTINFTIQEVICIGIVLPIVTSIALSLMQLVISLFSNSIISNIVIISVIIISAFYCNSFFIGNYLMILRSSTIIEIEGVYASSGIIISLLISLIAICLGIFKFNKYDILDKK